MSLGMKPQKPRSDGKTVIYRVDGTGRDMYIGRTNGGLLSKDLLHEMELENARQPEYPRMRHGGGNNILNSNISRPSTASASSTSTGFRPKNLSRTCEKFVHYKQDGTGRDGYVRVDHGGYVSNYSTTKNHSEQIFRSTLRTPSDTAPTPNRKPPGTPSSATKPRSNNQLHHSMTQSSIIHGMSAGTAGAFGISSASGFDFTNSNLYLSQKQIEQKNIAHAKQAVESNRLSQPKTHQSQPQIVSEFSVVNSRYSYYVPKKQPKNRNAK